MTELLQIESLREIAHRVFGGDMRLEDKLYPDSPVRIVRISEFDWHYCGQCYMDAPTFLCRRYRIVAGEPTDGHLGQLQDVVRCCWQCGSMLERLK